MADFRGTFRDLAAAAAIVASAVGILTAAPASAQQLVYRFQDPSFGGNPFNAEHLMAIANIDRPAAPKEAVTPPLTEQQLIVQQIQSRLLSSLTSNLVSTITNAKPGQSGEFTLGDQIIRYTKTTTETRVTFINTVTGEQNEIVIPTTPTGSASATAQGTSAEQQILSSSANSLGVLAGISASGTNGVTNSAVSSQFSDLPAGPPPL
jgi:curli production assembly/transport component CsgF